MPFDLSDVTAAMAREREFHDRLISLQVLRSRAFAQGYVEALEQGASAEEWRALYVEKAR